jgi:putative PIN family toxin of toxin-antitoxin system
MRSAVLDTNVIVSGLLRPGGAPATITDWGFSGQFRWYASEAILAEYQVVLARKRLGIASRRAADFFADLYETAVMVVPARKFHECADANDDKFLECALEARADYVVTGNVGDFPNQFQDIRVVAPRQFLTLLTADPR